MRRRSSSNEDTDNFQIGSKSPVEDLNEAVKEEPASPVNGESETSCNADADGEDDGNDKKCVQNSRRRVAHTVAEQKRRDAIKKGYDDLQRIVASCKNEESTSPKLSKAVILQKSIEYLRFILDEKDRQAQDNESLKQEVLALQIMKANYEQIAKSTYDQKSTATGHAVTDEAKFNVFVRVMESLFTSFNDAAQVTSFSTLSASIFKWLEEECKPQKLQEIVLDSLRNTNVNGV